MNTFDHINQIVTLLQQNAAKIGITVAGLMVAIYAIWIMVDNDHSPQARTERWAKLRRVFYCAVIIASTGAFIQFALFVGGKI